MINLTVRDLVFQIAIDGMIEASVATLRPAPRSFTSMQEQAILNPRNRQIPAYEVEDDMANRQQRNNREKKKPKADKNKKKDKAPISPFASALNPASVAPGSIGKKA